VAEILARLPDAGGPSLPRIPLHPADACAWCSHDVPSELIATVHNLTHAPALRCTDVVACVRREYAARKRSLAA
jgi:hypothetical protein